MKNAWLVRPFPHGTKRLDEFKTQNIVAVGWPGIGDLTNKSRENIKKILSGEPYQLNGLELGNAYATIDIFVNRMQVGDFILTPDGDDIYFGEITSDYYMESSVNNDNTGYPHQRKVKWLNSTLRKSLSMPLRSSLKVHRTTADLSVHVVEIESLANGKDYKAEKLGEANVISVNYPLRPDYTVSFNVPSNISKDEAKRLSNYLETLYFVQ